ncbi:MAG: BNR repeat-containing protein [bacterium]
MTFLSTYRYFCCFAVIAGLTGISIDAHGEILRRVPVAEGLASHPVNGGNCLISDGTYQYLAFYDGDHQATVAKRILGTTDWEFAKLPEKVGWDTHNRLVLFMDRDGYLHLTGNMHASPLRYYRTAKPGGIQTFEPVHTWTGKDEERVTYPTLLQLRDGSIHMMYRLGGSGSGKNILVHYSEKDRKWTGGDAFLSGMESEPDSNAYPFGGIQEDRRGVLHIAWCWRETPDVETNFDIGYAKSEDGGLTWKQWDGTKYELPIRPENAEVVDDIPQRAGLMNGGSLAIGADGNPYIGYTRFDAAGHNQIYVATPVEKTWRIIQLTKWEARFWFEGRGTIPEYPPIPRLAIEGDGRIRVRYSSDKVSPPAGEMVFTRDQLLSGMPGDFEIHPGSDDGPGIPNIRAVNQGPLPNGEIHYMTQEVDRPNRDRQPENPQPPTMIYIVETK